MTLSLNASTATFSLSMLTSTRPNASKRLIADAHGLPSRDRSHKQGIARGQVQHVAVPGLAGLRDLIARTTARQALVHGIPRDSHPDDVYQLVLKDTYTGAPGTVARTLECFTYPEDLFLLMLDHDTHPAAPVLFTTPEELLAILCTLDPVFARVGWLAMTSTSSAIKSKTTPRDVADWLTPPYGMHLYLLARGDVTRWVDWLTVKLWLAGAGYCRLAQTNTATGVAAVLERCVLDLAVFSPERLDYVAGAIIARSAPFYQDRPPPVLQEGEILDIDALQPITDAERTEAQARQREAREPVEREQQRGLRTHITTHSPSMPEEELDREITRRLDQAARGELETAHPLYFVGMGPCTAGTVTKRHDGKRLADPLDPEAEGDAVFHWNTGGSNWRIVSWAHGGPTTYQLAAPAPPHADDDDLAALMDQADQETSTRVSGVDHCPYANTPAGIVRHTQRDKDRVTTRLTNFTATILADILEDDGVETRLFFELGTRLNGHAQTFKIPASQFAGMNWATEHMGGRAIIMPGMGLKDHARAAIQMLSSGIAARHIYTHIGWRQFDTGWAYLHAGGAVGAAGAHADVTVEPGTALAPYVLCVPETPVAAQAAFLASMQMLLVAPPTIVVPLYGAIWRALLGMSDLSLHLTGDTGMGKSELAALDQQHWGGAMHGKQLPAAWSSTANALEVLAFQAKDALLVIDDFCPRGSAGEVAALHGKADRVLRAQGNRSARQRLERSGDRGRPAKPPRGLIVSTGEDIPQGQSLRARICVLEVAPDTVNWARLSPCQADAAAGLYAQAMAAFVQWLAPHYGEVLATLSQDLITLRAAAVQTTHRRTPELVANLALGWRYFLACAQDLGVLSAAECAQFWAWAWRTLGEVGSAQQAHQAEEDPVRRFLALLWGTITAGQAHIQDARRYGPPAEPQDWGWTVRETTTMTTASQEWIPHGSCVGYLEGDRLYLEPNASYSAVQRMADTQRAPLAITQRAPLAITQRTLHKRMHERGLLTTQPSQTHHAISKRLGPAQKLRRVLDLAVSSLMPMDTPTTHHGDVTDTPHMAGVSVTTGNNGNNGNRETQDQPDQDVPLLPVPPWSLQEVVTRGGKVVTSPATTDTTDPIAAGSVTSSVTSSARVVTTNFPELSPQLIEKKYMLLKLPQLPVMTDTHPYREEKSSCDTSSLTDEVTV